MFEENLLLEGLRFFVHFCALKIKCFIQTVTSQSLNVNTDWVFTFRSLSIWSFRIFLIVILTSNITLNFRLQANKALLNLSAPPPPLQIFTHNYSQFIYVYYKALLEIRCKNGQCKWWPRKQEGEKCLQTKSGTRMTTSILKQDWNREKVKKNAIYYNKTCKFSG